MSVKRTIVDIIFLSALLTSLIIRLIVNKASWISFVNCVSLIISIASLFFEILSLHGGHKRFPHFIGIVLTVLIILTVLAVLFLLSVIEADAKVNDCITLITLIIALPTKLYINISNKIFK